MTSFLSVNVSVPFHVVFLHYDTLLQPMPFSTNSQTPCVSDDSLMLHGLMCKLLKM